MLKKLGRKICAERYKVSPDVRATRRTGTAQKSKQRAGRGSEESSEAAPASDQPVADAIPVAAMAWTLRDPDAVRTGGPLGTMESDELVGAPR